MWRGADPGFPPSPDPAAQAEDHFCRQSLADPDDVRDECSDCRGRGWFVGNEPRADCDTCHGDGFYFGHTEACVNDACALNGDMFSCSGETQPCECVTVNCEPCTFRVRDAEVEGQRSAGLDELDTEVPF